MIIEVKLEAPTLDRGQAGAKWAHAQLQPQLPMGGRGQCRASRSRAHGSPRQAHFPEERGS